jgi:hypothetical protein
MTIEDYRVLEKRSSQSSRRYAFRATPHHMGSGFGFRVRPPLRKLHHARLNQLHIAEQPSYFIPGTQHDRFGHHRVQPAERLGDVLALDIARQMAERHVTARRQRSGDPAHHPARIVVTTEEVQDAEDHDRNRPGKSSVSPAAAGDRLGLAQLPPDIPGRALGRAAQQLMRMGEHHRIAIDIHDPRFRRLPLRDLVHIVLFGKCRSRYRGTA